MTTSAFAAEPTSRRSPASLVTGAIVLLAAITFVLVVAVGRIGGGSAGTSGSDSGQDNSNCRPTTVVHCY